MQLGQFEHDLAEALSAQQAGSEVGDPRNKFMGIRNGVCVKAWLSKQRGLRVIPDMASDSTMAAMLAVPGVTG